MLGHDVGQDLVLDGGVGRVEFPDSDGAAEGDALGEHEARLVPARRAGQGAGVLCISRKNEIFSSQLGP